MSLHFFVCEYSSTFDNYLKFLLEHHSELNLPYDFAMKLSFISSPIVFGKVIVCVDEEEHSLEGVLGYVYGTGANDYQDQDVCQIEVAFCKSSLRSTPLFLRGLKYFTAFVSEDNKEVKQVQFWASAEDQRLRRLFSKIDAMQRTEVGQLDFYQVSLDALKSYCDRF